MTTAYTAFDFTEQCVSGILQSTRSSEIVPSLNIVFQNIPEIHPRLSYIGQHIVSAFSTDNIHDRLFMFNVAVNGVKMGSFVGTDGIIYRMRNDALYILYNIIITKGR